MLVELMISADDNISKAYTEKNRQVWRPGISAERTLRSEDDQYPTDDHIG